MPSFFCAAVGARLTIYRVDVAAARLTEASTVELPGNMQYGWPSPDGRLLYAATSNGGPRIKGDRHELSVWKVDEDAGTLRAFGEAAPLRSRPVHVSLDAAARHALVAYHHPAGLSVHRIRDDGSIGEEVSQSRDLDFGVYPHQIMASPAGDRVILVTRGNDPTKEKPEEPGALKLFAYEDGVLTPHASIAPNGGNNFGPRDLDFHPTLPLVYVSLERQNRLHVYRMENGALSEAPVFVCETMQDPSHLVYKQVGGAVHLHPNGRILYVANRGGPHNPLEVHTGGENAIAVFEIDQETGEPNLIQHAETTGNRPRTFSIDPSARVLIVINMQPRLLEEDGVRRQVPAGIATFHMSPDGRLEFAHRYDVEIGDASLFWGGLISFET